jgi:hypothetical protein
MSIDLSTDRGKVRLLVPDRNEARFAFSDAEIDAFLSLDSDVRRAAATALETAASNLALTLRVTETLGLKVDGARASDALLKRAAALRSQADDADARDGGLFDIAEFALEPFGTEERLHNELLRSGL